MANLRHFQGTEYTKSKIGLLRLRGNPVSVSRKGETDQSLSKMQSTGVNFNWFLTCCLFGLNTSVSDLDVLICAHTRVAKHRVIGMEIASGLSVTCASQQFVGV